MIKMCSEIEARQQAELTTRNMQLEMRSAQNTIKEVQYVFLILSDYLGEEYNKPFIIGF